MVNVGLMQPILAQVAFGGTWSSILGIALAGSGIALYALRSLRPKLARDYDIFFAAVALLCGGILFFQGWRQDPILQFGQFLLTGSAVFFAVENIRLRGIATEQARRNTPIEDFERPVSPKYRYDAELEELNSFEERMRRPRIQASREPRASRDEYDEGASRRTSRRPSLDDRSSSDRPRKRRPRPTGDTSDYSDYSGIRDDNEFPSERPGRSRSSSPSRSGNDSPSASRSRRPRPTDDTGSIRDRARKDDTAPSEYVDYRPINDDEEDNWGDY